MQTCFITMTNKMRQLNLGWNVLVLLKTFYDFKANLYINYITNRNNHHSNKELNCRKDKDIFTKQLWLNWNIKVVPSFFRNKQYCHTNDIIAILLHQAQAKLQHFKLCSRTFINSLYGLILNSKKPSKIQCAQI